MLMRVCGLIALIYQFANVSFSIELSDAQMSIFSAVFQ